MSDTLVRIKRAVLAGCYAFSEKASLEMEVDCLSKRLHITTCPTCGSDRIQVVVRNLERKYQGRVYMVPDVTFYECPVCGEKVFDREAMLKIEAYSPAYRTERERVSA